MTFKWVKIYSDPSYILSAVKTTSIHAPAHPHAEFSFFYSLYVKSTMGPQNWESLEALAVPILCET